ncbi:MAG: hypothetical protein RL062_679 [Bacteroidota bacterium]
MNKTQLICLGILILLSGSLAAQEKVRIGILAHKTLQEINFKVMGNGAFISDQKSTWISSENSNIQIRNVGGMIRYTADTVDISCAKIILQAGNEGYFQVQLTPQSRKLKYGETIEIKVVNNQLQIVNVMMIDTYISGVVEAEGGPNHDLEYYKAQAVISRTYLLSQFYKHIDDGYNLCDQTHCQAFNGLPKHEHIMVNAAEQTKSLVIVDDNANLITAAFHSNCGGRTNNSENVWSRPLSYCRAVEDTFCMKMPNSNWEKRIPLQEWTRYLESKKIESTDSANYAYFPGEKEVYYREGNTKVPLVTMRKDLKLKSTYFSAHQDGNDIVLIGQGFGHGVGLCQEGAIRMAQLGYGFEDIIHFYYTQVKIIPYQYIAFFKLE